MATITENIAALVARIDRAFRDAVSPGIPATGANRPDKADIRSIGPLLSAILSALLNNQITGLLVYETRAQLYADLSPAARFGGLVVSDPNPAYNGLYQKQGAAGAGSWLLMAGAAFATPTELIGLRTLIANLLAIDNIRPSGDASAGFIAQLTDILNVTPEGVTLGSAQIRALMGALLGVSSGPTELFGIDDGGALTFPSGRLRFAAGDFLKIASGRTDVMSVDERGDVSWARMPKNAVTAPPKVVGMHAGVPYPDGWPVAGFIEGYGPGNYTIDVFADAAETISVYASGLRGAKVRPAAETPAGWGSIRTFNDQVRGPGIAPNQTYWIVMTVDGVRQPVCRWKTAPAAGSATAFRYGVTSCANFRSPDAAKILRAAANEGFLFFALIGDNNYDEPNGPISTKWLAEYTTLSNSDFQAFARLNPLFWAKDDHDFGFNNSSLGDVYADGRSASTHFAEVVTVARLINARRPYMQEVEGEKDPTKMCMATTFDVGQHRFTAVDTRRFRRKAGAEKTCLGNGQTADWNQLDAVFGPTGPLATSGANGIKRNVLFSPTTWGPLNDAWGDTFPEERAIVATRTRDMAGAAPIMIEVGDQHRFTRDWSANSDAATGGGFSAAVIGCSPMHHLARPVPGPQSWFGANGDLGSSVVNGYVAFDARANGEFGAKVMALPLIGEDDPATVSATEYAAFSSDAAGQDQTVQFAAASGAGASSSIQIVRSIPHRVGATTVDWSDGVQNGTLTLRPNCWKYTLPATVPAGRTITLSNPVNCVLGAQTTHART